MRKALIVLIILMINASLGVSYQVSNIENKAYPGDQLVYNITLINNDTTSKQLYLNSFIISQTFKGQTIIEPSINIKLEPNSNQTVTLKASVEPKVNDGLYQVPLIISYDNVTEKLFLKAVILNSNVNPIKISSMAAISEGGFKPLESKNITITLVATSSINPLISIAVSSNDEIVYNSESITPLTSGLNIITKTVKLPKVNPGSYQLIINAELNNELLSQAATNITVEPFESIITNLTIKENLLGKTIIKEVINNGTTSKTININQTINPLEMPLIVRKTLTVMNDNEVINDYELIINDYQASSNVSLNPGDKAVMIIRSDYSVLIITPLLIISGLLAWVYLNKKVIIKKEIMECRKQGNELVIKVGIKVKNVSMKSVKNVRVIDDLPLYARKAGGFGSLIGEINTNKGVITFNAGRLDSKEELLLSYKFKTDVELIGRISLPPATIKYTVKGKTITSKSNTPIIHLIKGGA